MDDEREEKLIYQSVVSLFKLLSKFTMGIPVNNVYFSYTWRMFRIYVLKPEVLAISLLVLFIILYIQTIDVYSKSVLRKLGLSFEERARLRRSQLTFGIDINSSSWEHKVGNVAAFAVQGRRPHMEDRFVIKDNINNTGLSMFAVFDGHGGTFAAEYATEHLINSLKNRVIEIKSLNKRDIRKAQDAIHSNLKNINKRPSVVSKKNLKKISHTDDMKNNNISSVDDDLLQMLEKVLPVRKDIQISSSKPITLATNPAELYINAENGNVNYSKLLTDEVLAIDRLLVDNARKNSDIAGTTALIALVEGSQLIVANVGDSRGVMCDSKGNTIPLSFDHKPDQMREKKRIQEAGGFITFNGVWRVAGILATSRALGDFPLKDRNLVIADPDILTFDLSDHKPQFLIFASDGLWDTFTNEEAVAFIKEHLHEPLYGAKSITLQAYSKGSADNITVLIIDLSKHDWTDTINVIKSESQ